MSVNQAATAPRLRNRFACAADPGRWFSWDAMRRATPRAAMAYIAEALGRSTSLLEKWCREYGPHEEQNGERNPAQYLHDFTEAAVAAGVPFEDAIAPVVWVCHRLGLDVVHRTPNVNGDRPFLVGANLSENAGVAVARLFDCLDENSLGGKRITLEERRELRPVIEKMEQAVRDFSALIDVGAA